MKLLPSLNQSCSFISVPKLVAETMPVGALQVDAAQLAAAGILPAAAQVLAAVTLPAALMLAAELTLAALESMVLQLGAG